MTFSKKALCICILAFTLAIPVANAQDDKFPWSSSKINEIDLFVGDYNDKWILQQDFESAAKECPQVFLQVDNLLAAAVELMGESGDIDADAFTSNGKAKETILALTRQWGKNDDNKVVAMECFLSLDELTIIYKDALMALEHFALVEKYEDHLASHELSIPPAPLSTLDNSAD